MQPSVRVLVGILALTPIPLTVSVNPAAAAKRLQPWQVQALALAKQIGNSDTQATAIAAIRKELHTDPHHTVGPLFMYWLNPEFSHENFISRRENP